MPDDEPAPEAPVADEIASGIPDDDSATGAAAGAEAPAGGGVHDGGEEDGDEGAPGTPRPQVFHDELGGLGLGLGVLTVSYPERDSLGAEVRGTDIIYRKDVGRVLLVGEGTSCAGIVPRGRALQVGEASALGALDTWDF
jgi:hypothetical protein